jgi:hypothetical protein
MSGCGTGHTSEAFTSSVATGSTIGCNSLFPAFSADEGTDATCVSVGTGKNNTPDSGVIPCLARGTKN